MTNRLKLSLATLEIRHYLNLGSFVAHMRDLVAAAQKAGSDMLVLPELAGVGLLWTNPQAGTGNVKGVADLYDGTLTPIYDDYRNILTQLAVESKVAIAGATFWHRQGVRRLNTGFVFTTCGAALLQDKLHPTRPERAILTEGGDRLITFDIAGIRLGMAICYDLQFPEIVRSLANAGAEVILTPSLTDKRGYWRIRHCAHARAIENQCYICVSPLVGDLGIPPDHPLKGYGEAYVACPIDNRFGITDGTYARAEPDRESLLHVTLDLDLLRLSRLKAEIRPLADRRDDLYQTLKPSHRDHRYRRTPDEIQD